MKEEYPAKLAQLRFEGLLFKISLAVFTTLLVWQGVVLATDSYPGHILPVVKLLSGTQEVLPVAYAWTTRLAVITLAGWMISLIGWLGVRRATRNRLTPRPDRGISETR